MNAQKSPHSTRVPAARRASLLPPSFPFRGLLLASFFLQDNRILIVNKVKFFAKCGCHPAAAARHTHIYIFVLALCAAVPFILRLLFRLLHMFQFPTTD